jgi:hypothetical protein
METLTGVVAVTLSPNTLYLIRMIDQNHLEVIDHEDNPLISDVNGVLTIQLPEKYTKYDGWFALEVSTISGNIVYLDSVVSTRPYVDAQAAVDYMKGKINLEQALEYEHVARQLINSIVGYEFIFTRKDIHVVGNGSDFATTDDRINKVFSVRENNVVVWEDGGDFFYKPWVNLYGVVRDAGFNTDNRMEHSITWYNRYDSPQFKFGWDYVFDVEAGWPVIPNDIRLVTLLLINDIACGNNRYFNKYIESWRTSGQSIYYMPEVIGGTGNLYVDNILSKYVLGSIRPKVL